MIARLKSWAAFLLLSRNERKVLAELKHYSETDWPCFHSRAISAATGLMQPEAKAAAQRLVARGMAAVQTGLEDEDGRFYGSGWHLTDTGLRWRERLNP